MFRITETADAQAAAQTLADAVAADLRRVLAESPQAVLAVSGGKSPVAFFEILSRADLDWARVALTLADEPTKGLDPSRIRTVIEAFQKLQTQAVLCVTHDLTFAESYADQIVVMYAGHQLEISAKDEFFREPRHPYSQALLAALPENGLHDLTGFAPPHTSEGGGQCIFFDRCPRRFSLCEKEPPMIQQDDREVRCWLYAADHAGDYRTLSERGASVRP